MMWSTLHYFVCIIIICSSQIIGSDAHGSHWGYSSDTIRPQDWADISNSQCGSWQQSPININTSATRYYSSLAPINFKVWIPASKDDKYVLKNDGHKVSLSIPTNEEITVSFPESDGCFRVNHIHWHWGSEAGKGSEHAINGKHYPMEAHVVTWNCRDYKSLETAAKSPMGLAVFGFFYEIVAEERLNPMFDKLTEKLHEVKKADGYAHEAVETYEFTSVNFLDLLPKNKNDYYRYMGSLTTPNCDQNVMWTVFKQPQPITASQIQRFREELKYPNGDAMVDNFRPVQPLNKPRSEAVYRIVTKSFKY